MTSAHISQRDTVTRNKLEGLERLCTTARVHFRLSIKKGGGMEKEFFDAVVSAVASKVLESNIVANEIARQVTLNKTAVERAVDIIDPTVLSASLADVIFKYMSSSRYGQFTDTATTTYSETM